MTRQAPCGIIKFPCETHNLTNGFEIEKFKCESKTKHKLQTSSQVIFEIFLVMITKGNSRGYIVRNNQIMEFRCFAKYLTVIITFQNFVNINMRIF